MKNTRKPFSFLVAILAIVCLSYSTGTAQDYVGKAEAIEVLQNELKSISAELPGLEENSNDYTRATEKLRVFKNVLRDLGSGYSVEDALDRRVPSEDDNTFQAFVIPVPDENGKMDAKWIIEVINDLLTD